MERFDPILGLERGSQLVQQSEGHGRSGVQASQPSSDSVSDILTSILDAPTSRGLRNTSGQNLSEIKDPPLEEVVS